MQEKPGISLTVLHLFCSENTCVTLAGETRTPGLTTPEVMLAAERCQDPSGHVVTVEVWSKLRPPCSHTSSLPPPVPQTLLRAMASHCCRDSTQVTSCLTSHDLLFQTTRAVCALKPYRIPERTTRTLTLLTDHRTVSHHFTNFKLKDNTEKLELHVGSGEVPDGVQGGLWDVNMGLWSRGD